MKVSKGLPGYVSEQKKRRLVRTIFLFALVFAVFGLGLYLNGGDRKNVFSIIAAVLCIPAAMSATGMIVLWTLHPSIHSIQPKAEAYSDRVKLLYELYITTRGKSLLLDVVALFPDRILAYASAENASAAKPELESYLKMQTSGLIPDLEVEIENDAQRFLQRLSILTSSEEQEDMEIVEELAGILLALSM
ncbi:MAG: hypothetical protein IKE31_07770 [Eubacterium sp.]|nr:hypothetical protein [Eubacterium sp.]